MENKIEICIESASLYTSLKEWRTGNNSTYTLAYRNGWLKECAKYYKK